MVAVANMTADQQNADQYGSVLRIMQVATDAAYYNITSPQTGDWPDTNLSQTSGGREGGMRQKIDDNKININKK